MNKRIFISRESDVSKAEQVANKCARYPIWVKDQVLSCDSADFSEVTYQISKAGVWWSLTN